MAVRYSAEYLLFLRDSPLCVKPDKLPSAEEWMGAPADHARAQNKPVGDRSRPLDNPLLDQTNRRPGINQVSRNNPEDIVFAPPRMAFASSTRGNKITEGDRPKDLDSQGRLNLRGRNGDLDGDRLRESRNTTLRRRGESDQDEGWSMVKPRKSFGADGAERFHGRMGGNFRDLDKKPPKDKEDRDATRERPTRVFDGFSRDNKDAGDVDGRPRNGLNRSSKLDSPWHKHDVNDTLPVPEKKERDRTKSWRDRDNIEVADDRGPPGRSTDRRWARDRDQRIERDPEWFDEPAEANRQSHTQQDFQKWMEQMKKAKGASASPEAPAPSAAVERIEEEKPQPLAAPAVPSAEAAPDKFFLAFGANTSLDTSTTSPSEPKDSTAKSKPAAKSSRFTSFFSQPSEEVRSRVEQPASVPPQAQYVPSGFVPPHAAPNAPPPEEERQAFQQLLAKLQKQSMSATPPAPSPFAAPPQPADSGKKSAYASPDPFQQYGGERRDGPSGRPPPPPVQEIFAPRPQQQSARPEQLLQDLVGHQRVSSQGTPVRPDQSRNNSNTEFLMNLMKSGPDTQQLLRMAQSQPQPQPQPTQQLQLLQQQQQQLQQQKPVPMPLLNDREPDFSPRESRPQRQMRPQPPPGFLMEEAFHNADRDARPAQPTQILQRQIPPPGLEMAPSWMTGGGQMPPPPQQRGGPMMPPPPGLPGGPNRNIVLPPMFPPNFPPVGMPPPDAMAGMPPRNMPPPPPGFFNGPPPHGFLPPGLAGFNGPPGPADSHLFGGSPFENRGMPPAGNGRGAAFGRP